ncbi:MAG: glycosyltransferase, partial [Patescibacteria group bacterium]
MINNLYPPVAESGASIVAQNIAEGLKSAGHDIFVISTAPYEDKNSFTPKKRELGGVRVYEFFPANVYHYLNGSRHNFFVRFIWHICDILNLHSFFVVKKILEDEKPDIVWTHNLMGVGMLAVEAVKLLGLRHWHTAHDVQLSLPSGLIIWGQENNAEAKSRLRPLYERAMRDILGNPEIV